MGILNVLGHFAAPALAPVLLNLAMISAVLFISPHLNKPVLGLAIGVVCGGVLQLGLQVPFLIRYGIKFWQMTTFFHPGLKIVGILSQRRQCFLPLFRRSTGSISARNFCRGHRYRTIAWLIQASRGKRC
jgi:peptidoglycan biosynthesis protein MviN/MurJ (putative lipid II flippase)